MKYSDYINPRKAYYRIQGAVFMGVIAFTLGVMSTGRAQEYECQSFREILAGFEYDYSPAYELPPKKPE